MAEPIPKSETLMKLYPSFVWWPDRHVNMHLKWKWYLWYHFCCTYKVYVQLACTCTVQWTRSEHSVYNAADLATEHTMYCTSRCCILPTLDLWCCLLLNHWRLEVLAVGLQYTLSHRHSTVTFLTVLHMQRVMASRLLHFIGCWEHLHMFPRWLHHLACWFFTPTGRVEVKIIHIAWKSTSTPVWLWTEKHSGTSDFNFALHTEKLEEYHTVHRHSPGDTISTAAWCLKSICFFAILSHPFQLLMLDLLLNLGQEVRKKKSNGKQNGLCGG